MHAGMQASGWATLLVYGACRQATHLATRMPTGVRIGVIAGQHELQRDTLVDKVRAQNAAVSRDKLTCGRCGGLLSPGMF